jgi:hypothetical protein
MEAGNLIVAIASVAGYLDYLWVERVREGGAVKLGNKLQKVILLHLGKRTFVAMVEYGHMQHDDQ